jgi:hypothetical protein
MLLLANGRRAIAVKISVGPNEDRRIEQSRYPKRPQSSTMTQIDKRQHRQIKVDARAAAPDTEPGPLRADNHATDRLDPRRAK